MFEKPYFIAEVSSNHSRDLNRCLNFIKIASEIGCDAVKFQLFRIDKLFAPEVIAASATHRNRKAWELPTEFLPVLSEYAKSLQLEFSCTPFDIEAVQELNPYVDFFKVSSYELLWDDLILECAKTRRDLVLSTGMATIDEITHAVSVFKTNSSAQLNLLHTVSGYPTPLNEANLGVISTLRNEFNCKVGLSDHTKSDSVILRAVHRWGAELIEFHLDIDAQGAEYGAGHCWLPTDIKKVIDSVREGFNADGTGEKTLMPSEKSDRMWRADPLDGLRPMKIVRKNFNGQ